MFKVVATSVAEIKVRSHQSRVYTTRTDPSFQLPILFLIIQTNRRRNFHRTEPKRLSIV